MPDEIPVPPPAAPPIQGSAPAVAVPSPEPLSAAAVSLLPKPKLPPDPFVEAKATIQKVMSAIGPSLRQYVDDGTLLSAVLIINPIRGFAPSAMYFPDPSELRPDADKLTAEEREIMDNDLYISYCIVGNEAIALNRKMLEAQVASRAYTAALKDKQ